MGIAAVCQVSQRLTAAFSTAERVGCGLWPYSCSHAVTRTTRLCTVRTVWRKATRMHMQSILLFPLLMRRHGRWPHTFTEAVKNKNPNSSSLRRPLRPHPPKSYPPLLRPAERGTTPRPREAELAGPTSVGIGFESGCNGFLWFCNGAASLYHDESRGYHGQRQSY